MSRRTERIAEQLRADVARVLRESVSDPRVGLVTLTRVDVAPDLSNAIVFWSALDARGGDAVDLDAIQDGLDSSASFIGREVARKAVEAGVQAVVFDRGAARFHGRVKALAEAAREGGLKF